MLKRPTVVNPHCALVSILAVAFWVPAVRSQSSVMSPPETPPDDRSFYIGQSIDHPEDLSGMWETFNEHGGAIGIHLEVMTSVSGDARPILWSPQTWQHLNLSVFERKGPELAFGEENYFADNVRGSSVKLEDGHLQLHFVAPQTNRSQAQIDAIRALGIEEPSAVDLDLMRQPDGCWHGRFHRGSFDSMVTLCRPMRGSADAVSPLAGTWSSDNDDCIHIFQTGPGSFIGWSDALEVPGRVVFGPNIPGPHQLYQNYGALAKIHLANNGEVSLELGAYNPICCSHLFIGTLSSDGSTLQGNFPPGPNQAPHAATWTKLSSDFCVDPASLYRLKPIACPPGKN